LLFLAAFWVSPSFRALVMAGDLPLLTTLQAWRFAGFVFIALHVYGVLPGVFARARPSSISNCCVIPSTLRCWKA
jgi:hypothetical protein